MSAEGQTIKDGDSTITVIEQRSFIEKIWSKHKRPIMIVGGIILGVYVYNNVIKKK